MGRALDETQARPAASLRAAARFLYENGVGEVDRIRGFLKLDAAAFARLRRIEGWARRRQAPPARTLKLYLAAFSSGAQTASMEAPPATDARRLALALTRFADERIASLAEDSGARGATREIVDLTRCLKELAALEAAAEARERSEANAAGLASGAASDLAEIVALQVERLHRRCAEGGDLEALYPADEGASGE